MVHTRRKPQLRFSRIGSAGKHMYRAYVSATSSKHEVSDPGF